MTNKNIIEEEEKSCQALDEAQDKLVHMSAKLNSYIQKNGNSKKLKKKSARCHRQIETIAEK